MAEQAGWYYLQEGQQKGPVSSAQIKALLNDKILTAETSIWNPSVTAGWMPIYQVAEFKSSVGKYSVPKITNDPLPGAATFLDPWRRLFARAIDLILFTAISNATITPWLYFHLTQYANAFDVCGTAMFSQVFFLLVSAVCQGSWMVQEALCLSIIGTTAGKWLFGISVVNQEGHKLTFFQAFWRAFKIYVRGLGLFIWQLSIFCLIVQYIKVCQGKQASWDREGGFRIDFANLSLTNLKYGLVATKSVVSIVIIVALFVLPIAALRAGVKNGSRPALMPEKTKVFALSILSKKTNVRQSFGYLASALEFFKRGDYAKADEKLTLSLICDPGNVYALALRGLARAEMGDSFGAVNDYRQAIWRCDLLRYQQSVKTAICQRFPQLSFLKRNDITGDFGETDYPELLAQLHYNCAYDLNILGDRAEAREEYTKALREKPNFPNALCNRGHINFDFGNTEQAMADYGAAISYDPKHAQSYYNRAMAKGNLGQNKEAIPDFDAAIKYNPNDASYYYGRSVAKNYCSIDTGLIEDLSNAIRLDPNYLRAYNNRANAYCKNQQWREALIDCNKGLAIDPQFSMLYTNRGIALLGLGDVKAALADLEKADQMGAPGAHEVLEKVKTSLGKQ